MKRTPLTRKTPLGAKKGSSTKGSPLKTHKPLKQMSVKRAAKLKETGSSPYSTLSTKKPLIGNSSLSTNSSLTTRTPLNQQSKKNASAPAKRKRNSMTGHARTSGDIAFHTRIVALGCAACNMSGRMTTHPLQVHHPEGRSRGAVGDYKERFALCLCAEHHDQRIYNGFMNGLTWVPADKSLPSVHHAKKAFYSRYGSEHFLVHEQYLALNEMPPWLTDEEWKEYGELFTQSCKEDWLKLAMSPASASQRRAIASS